MALNYILFIIMAAKDETIKALQRNKEVESTAKVNAISEKERVMHSYEKLVEEKAVRNENLEHEVLALRNQLSTFEVLKQENENLRSDLDSILNERRGLHVKVGEITQIRAENYDLKAKADRVQEFANENRMLKQELRDIESRHLEVADRINRENITLRRNVDDLFKKNQDLELRHVSYIRTRPRSNLYLEPNLSRLDPVKLTIRPKSSSVDNLYDFQDQESFSPIKNGVATSTPTMESQRFTSIMVTKAPSVERISHQGGGTVNAMKPATKVSSVEQGTKPSSIELLNPFQERNQLSTGPLVEAHETDDSRRKSEPNWAQPLQDSLNLSIKSNPFLKMDQSAKSNSKAAPTLIKIAPAQSSQQRLSPRKQTGRNELMFDMRSQASDIVEEEDPDGTKLSQTKTIGIGNEFVNRLKATFEKK